MGYNARWYMDDGHLRSFGRKHLEKLFQRYKSDLAAKNIQIPQPANDDDYYKELAEVFMLPDGIPEPLHDALYFIKGLDNASGLDRIGDAVNAGRLKIDLGEESSTADKVLQAWLQDESLVKHLHVEVGLDASKSFVFFQAQSVKAPVMRDFAKVRKDLNDSLCVIFEDKGRGYWSDVSCHPRGDDVVFVVRHGEPFRRETQRLKNATSPLFYWPSSQDLVVYNKKYRDLRMNVFAGWQKRAYAENVGEWLFGDRNLFVEAPLYTLEPIRSRGEAALNCDAFGMSVIRLVELHSVVDEDTNDIRIRHADNVFMAYEKDGGLPAKEVLSLAKFSVRFKESGRERVVTVEPPNRAKYTQDREGLCVTHWLREAGFVLPRIQTSGGEDE